MGTSLSLVGGIIVLLIGIGFFSWGLAFTVFSELPPLTVVSFGLGIMMAAVGAVLIGKYVTDKKKSENS